MLDKLPDLLDFTVKNHQDWPADMYVESDSAGSSQSTRTAQFNVEASLKHQASPWYSSIPKASQQREKRKLIIADASLAKLSVDELERYEQFFAKLYEPDDRGEPGFELYIIGIQHRPGPPGGYHTLFVDKLDFSSHALEQDTLRRMSCLSRDEVRALCAKRGWSSNEVLILDYRTLREAVLACCQDWEPVEVDVIKEDGYGGQQYGISGDEYIMMQQDIVNIASQGEFERCRDFFMRQPASVRQHIRELHWGWGMTGEAFIQLQSQLLRLFPCVDVLKVTCKTERDVAQLNDLLYCDEQFNEAGLPNLLVDLTLENAEQLLSRPSNYWLSIQAWGQIRRLTVRSSISSAGSGEQIPCIFLRLKDLIKLERLEINGHVQVAPHFENEWLAHCLERLSITGAWCHDLAWLPAREIVLDDMRDPLGNCRVNIRSPLLLTEKLVLKDGCVPDDCLKTFVPHLMRLIAPLDPKKTKALQSQFEEWLLPGKLEVLVGALFDSRRSYDFQRDVVDPISKLRCLRRLETNPMQGSNSDQEIPILGGVRNGVKLESFSAGLGLIGSNKYPTSPMTFQDVHVLDTSRAKKYCSPGVITPTWSFPKFSSIEVLEAIFEACWENDVWQSIDSFSTRVKHLKLSFHLRFLREWATVIQKIFQQGAEFPCLRTLDLGVEFYRESSDEIQNKYVECEDLLALLKHMPVLRSLRINCLLEYRVALASSDGHYFEELRELSVLRISSSSVMHVLQALLAKVRKLDVLELGDDVGWALAGMLSRVVTWGELLDGRLACVACVKLRDIDLKRWTPERLAKFFKAIPGTRLVINGQAYDSDKPLSFYTINVDGMGEPRDGSVGAASTVTPVSVQPQGVISGMHPTINADGVGDQRDDFAGAASTIMPVSAQPQGVIAGMPPSASTQATSTPDLDEVAEKQVKTKGRHINPAPGSQPRNGLVRNQVCQLQVTAEAIETIPVTAQFDRVDRVVEVRAESQALPDRYIDSRAPADHFEFLDQVALTAGQVFQLDTQTGNDEIPWLQLQGPSGIEVELKQDSETRLWGLLAQQNGSVQVHYVTAEPKKIAMTIEERFDELLQAFQRKVLPSTVGTLDGNPQGGIAIAQAVLAQGKGSCFERCAALLYFLQQNRYDCSDVQFGKCVCIFGRNLKPAVR